MAQAGYNDQSQKVRASHILVKHKESRRLASWKDPNGVEIKKRSVVDADKILMQYLQQINASSDPAAAFHEIASKYSDCSSANATLGGDLGSFKYEEMQKPFSEATFALKVGEITQKVVHTQSGSHLIMREVLQVRASHILVKHMKSRNPISRNPNNDTDGSLIKKRSVEEADKQLLQWLHEINNNKDPAKKFHEIASQYSDCGSYARSGDLGFFEFERMQKPFSKAAFLLQIGQITQYCVHSDSGSHLIMRTG